MKYKWELLDFDTKLFGFKTAKVTYVEVNSVRDLIADLKKNKVVYATYRVPTNNFSIIHELEKAGFLLIDWSVDLSLFLKNVQLLPIDKNIREAKNEDIKELKRIAGEVFVANRFYNDPIIPKYKAPLVYEQWIENSVLRKKADLVLVLEDGEIMGFITLEKNGCIPLVAVSKKSQGKGVARKIVNAALATFKKWGIQNVDIKTAMFNIPALRVYQSCGFKIIHSQATFRWAAKEQ